MSKAAAEDAKRLKKDDARLANQIVAILREVQNGRDGEPLLDMPKYGDMSNCRKIYFGPDTTYRNTHRIVYEVQPNRVIEVLEVVAIEQRADAYVYLLAAERLGVLPDESRPIFQRVHQDKIAERSVRRARRGDGAAE